jgi:hypothetical protein
MSLIPNAPISFEENSITFMFKTFQLEANGIYTLSDVKNSFLWQVGLKKIICRRAN